MSQKGRRRYESGHGSSGIGAFTTALPGEPGVYGVCRLLSNRCIPPLIRPSTLNVGTIGVGAGADVLPCFLVPVNEKVVLRGVPIEPSEPSGLDIDNARCFRLRDDLFFRRLIGGPLIVFGELGGCARSFVRGWLRAGVAGETVNVVSAGLGIGGCGKGTLRPDG